jgi:hypothetical protein
MAHSTITVCGFNPLKTNQQDYHLMGCASTAPTIYSLVSPLLYFQSMFSTLLGLQESKLTLEESVHKKALEIFILSVLKTSLKGHDNTRVPHNSKHGRETRFTGAMLDLQQRSFIVERPSVVDLM